MKDGAKILSNLALITQIGLTVVIILVGCIFLGKFLDEKLGTGVVFLIVFTILGVLSSFNYIFRIGTEGISGKRKTTTIAYDKEEIKKLSEEKDDARKRELVKRHRETENMKNKENKKNRRK